MIKMLFGVLTMKVSVLRACMGPTRRDLFPYHLANPKFTTATWPAQTSRLRRNSTTQFHFPFQLRMRMVHHHSASVSSRSHQHPVNPSPAGSGQTLSIRRRQEQVTMLCLMFGAMHRLPKRSRSMGCPSKRPKTSCLP